MRLSIIVPLLDEAAVLPELLRHLRRLQQGYPPLEVVLVDGGSSDDTCDLLAASGWQWTTAPRGRARQLNAGAAVATGDCLIFLHADTRLPDGALQAIGTAAADGAAGGFLGICLDGHGWRCRLIASLITLRSRLTRISTGDQVQWFRRDAFEAIGGFAALPLFEDLDIARRLRRYGPVRPLRLRATTSWRRWQQHGVWRTVLHMWGLRLAYSLGVPPARLAHHYEDVR